MTRGTALKIGSLGWAVLLAACAGEPEPTDSPPATTRLAEAASPDSEALLTQFWSELYALLGPEGASAIANVPTPKAPKGAYGWGHGCKKKVRYEIDLLAKAQPDECFYGICDDANLQSFQATYPGDLNVG